MRVSGIPYVQGRNSYSDPDGTKYGIAIHNTSNTASADNEASYATRRTDGVSSHFYVDGVKVIQSLDTTARAGHAGSGNGNNHAVAVEIRGVNGWTRQQWLDGVCWDLLGRVLAQACRAYGIAVRRASVGEMQSNPKVKAFYGHDDMRRAWGGTTHTDPGDGFPWDRLFTAVNTALNPAAAGGSMELTSTVTEIALDGDVPTGWGVANPETAQLPLSFVFGSLHRRLYLVYKGLVATYTEVRALRTNPPPATALTEAQLDDLANRVFDKLATKLGDTLIGALTDPRAVEAYRQGANAAEDT